MFDKSKCYMKIILYTEEIRRQGEKFSRTWEKSKQVLNIVLRKYVCTINVLIFFFFAKSPNLQYKIQIVLLSTYENFAAVYPNKNIVHVILSVSHWDQRI